MKLTDADRAAIVAEWDKWMALAWPNVVDAREHLFLAGKRAGREEMRERAAKTVRRQLVEGGLPRTGAALAELIRALGVDDD